MKNNYILSIITSVLVGIQSAAAVSYIPFGGQCEPGNTQILCMPPFVCFASPDGGSGYCMASCNTELDDPFDVDKNTWATDADPSKQGRNCVPCDSWANCTPTKQFRCNYNYYGNPDQSVACKPCPENGTSLGGSKKITDCYLPAGSTGNNIAGKFEIKNGKCPYIS